MDALNRKGLKWAITRLYNVFCNFQWKTLTACMHEPSRGVARRNDENYWQNHLLIMILNDIECVTRCACNGWCRLVSQCHCNINYSQNRNFETCALKIRDSEKGRNI